MTNATIVIDPSTLSPEQLVALAAGGFVTIAQPVAQAPVVTEQPTRGRGKSALCPDCGKFAKADGTCNSQECSTPDIVAQILAQAPQSSPSVKAHAQAALAAHTASKTSRKQTQEPVVLGRRGNGRIARRSAYVVAEVTGMAQREIAALSFEDAAALVVAAGREVREVPASSL